jgi:hypothetical protein
MEHGGIGTNDVAALKRVGKITEVVAAYGRDVGVGAIGSDNSR